MIERRDRGDIAVLTFAHGKANTLDAELLEELAETLDRVEASAARAVVLTGSGAIFSAGVDLFRVLEEGPDYLDRFLPAISRGLTRLFAFERPTVAAVNGHAVAGGMVLISACDLRIAAAGPGRLGMPELPVGVPFPVAALEIVRFANPPQHLQDLVYRGRTVPPDEALALGMVDAVVPPERLLDESVEAAARLAALPAAAFRLTKRQLRGPALERIERLGPKVDPAVLAEWKTPATHARIRAYMERTVGKGGREG